MPPIREQTVMYHIMVFFPYRGATQKIIKRAAAMQHPPYARNQGSRKSFLKASMVDTDCCSGALRAITRAPRIHCVQPIQPKSVSFSLSIMWLRIAEITTDNAPMGVYEAI